MSKPLYQIIERPIISEKSVRESVNGRYTFRCKPGANKTEIAQAVAGLFDVKVAVVNTTNVKGKTKRVGRAPQGKKADWKKAVVTLAEGSASQRLTEIFQGA